MTNDQTLSTGSEPRRLQIPGSELDGVMRDDVYDRLPYFFSEQYDVGMECSGFARSWDRVVFRGDPAAGEFIAFWMTGERVVAGMNVNVWDVTDPIQRLIRERIAVTDAELIDPEISLQDLAPSKDSVHG